MMKRTFKGFLKAYCSELSGLETTSLKKLTAAANTESARVIEPLFCLALEEGKLEYLMRLAHGTRMETEWMRLLPKARRYKSARSWLENCSEAPERYVRVLSAYLSQDDMLHANRRMNALMRNRTLDALQTAHLTRYQMAKQLQINKGNLYAYLAGDDSKVSKDTARRIMDFATAAARAQGL